MTFRFLERLRWIIVDIAAIKVLRVHNSKIRQIEVINNQR